MSVKPSFQGEMMLAGWTESHNGGCKVTFWLPSPDDLDMFRGMTVRKGNTAGQRFMAVLVEIPDGELPPTEPKEEKPKREPNYLARKMMLDGYFRNPHLWQAMRADGWYSYDEHKDWVRTQPCVVVTNKLMDIEKHPCQGDIVAHHIQSASLPSAGNSSKTPRKVPDFYTVPICHRHHQTFAHGDATREEREKLKYICIDMTADRIKEVWKLGVGISSLSEISIGLLHSVEAELNLPPFVYNTGEQDA